MKTKRRWMLAGALLLLASFGLHRWRQAPLESSQDQPILAAARRYGVHPALVKAVVWRESRFNPTARGGQGEFGLMQIMEVTGREWAEAEHAPFYFHEQLFDPEKNTRAGTWYLRKALRRYEQTDSPAVYALADYNAGRANVLRWAKGAAATNSAEFLKQMTYPGTREYVKSVTRRFAHYAETFPPPVQKP
ncbi:MAG: lytic transglycosylase domain-containing protein [Pedosphaera sp.]|nr:lytic transglycosylase domain-containing protein [Pedosphaera sp.]